MTGVPEQITLSISPVVLTLEIVNSTSFAGLSPPKFNPDIVKVLLSAYPVPEFVIIARYPPKI